LLLPYWHEKANYNAAWSVGLASVATWGFFTLVRSNVALSEARAEVARLAAENERSRIARDLHDLLGHSLTTITVKASLASRIAKIDPQRSIAEITEVEELTRRALADVRAAVSGYHQVTLTGELASAREVLRAAGIDVLMPHSTDSVGSPLQELFGWVVREGVTNTVRHSRATRCTITFGSRWIEISDDGRAGLKSGGAGLAGLRDRVETLGGTLQAGPGRSARGWRLRAEFPVAVALTESAVLDTAPNLPTPSDIATQTSGSTR
jgi:two-component system sensor histidine kinase DesK